MLFSHRDLAEWMGATFECAWESVRDVPKVTVDFGGGNVVRRTLHGNVVTWVTDADGRAIEALGGLYEPAAYRARLEQAAMFAALLREQETDAARDAAFADWHGRQAERLAAGAAALVVERTIDPAYALAKFRVEDMFKHVIAEPRPPQVPETSILRIAGVPEMRSASKLRAEGPTERALAGDNGDGGAKPEKAIADVGAAKTLAEGSAGVLRAPLLDRPRPTGEILEAPGVRADRGLLAQDTAAGETIHRPAIHALLARSGRVPYATLSRAVYRDVLHLDLDDPWLGLGDLLFSTYPFEK